MEEDYVMIPGSGTKKIIRDVKKEIETAFLDYSIHLYGLPQKDLHSYRISLA